MKKCHWSYNILAVYMQCSVIGTNGLPPSFLLNVLQEDSFSCSWGPPGYTAGNWKPHGSFYVLALHSVCSTLIDLFGTYIHILVINFVHILAAYQHHQESFQKNTQVQKPLKQSHVHLWVWAWRRSHVQPGWKTRPHRRHLWGAFQRRWPQVSGKDEGRHRKEQRGTRGLENENKQEGRVWLRDGVKDCEVHLGLSEKGANTLKSLFSSWWWW